MSDSFSISADRILVISDIHQRTNWADAVLEKEAGNYDHIVFLGDVFDSFDEPPAVTGIRETARWYRKLIERKDVTVLAGNHELPYLESHFSSKQFKKKIPLLNSCAGYSNGKSLEIAKEMEWVIWQKVRLFVLANGWLLSHAGIRENYWWNHLTDVENLANLNQKAEAALEMAPYRPDHLFAVGFSRGGSYDSGGPLWLDWDTEFEDNLPYPQIVGHSSDELPRRKGRSYCIDTGTTYALLEQKGSIQIKSLQQLNSSGKWHWEPVAAPVRDDTPPVTATFP